MDNIKNAILDFLSYVVPGALFAVVIVGPFAFAGIIQWKTLGVGDAIISLPLLYLLGVVCSSIRPLRFRKSKTGTDEGAFNVTSFLGDSHNGLLSESVKFISDGMLDITPWTFHKHLVLRFFLEREDMTLKEFSRRQLALRQLRYNTSVPLGILSFELAVLAILGAVKIISPIYAVPIGVAGCLICAYICATLRIAARANIVREVLYVFSAAVSYYFHHGGAGKQRQSENNKADTSVSDSGYSK